jgi:hypothetical protein
MTSASPSRRYASCLVAELLDDLNQGVIVREVGLPLSSWTCSGQKENALERVRQNLDQPQAAEKLRISLATPFASSNHGM